MPPRKRPPSRTAPPAPLDTVAAHIAPFLHYLDAECGLAKNTRLAYGRDLEKFAAWLESTGNPSIRRIDLKRLTDFVAELRERKLAFSSIARHLVSIKMLFRYLVLEGVLSDSVAELTTSPKLWQHLPKVLSPERVNQLIAAPQSGDPYPARDRALLSVLYATGCRASEVAGLTMGSMHLAEGYCRCVGKGNKERMVSLNPVAVEAIERYLVRERDSLAKRGNADEVFLTRTGRAMTRGMIWNLVKRYAARIGAGDAITPHTLRHSFATHMLAGGAEIRALQELLGHASIRTTQIYTHVEHSRLKAVHTKCHPRG